MPELGLSQSFLEAKLRQIICDSPTLTRTLEIARGLALPDWWLVSGAIYNQVWNDLTGKPDMYGVKDIDLFYFDPDTSYAAEDRVIQRGNAMFSGNIPVEIRNQARVHIWYELHFGYACPRLKSCKQGIDNFASKTHSIGVRLEPDDNLTLYAPYGLQDIFALRIVPNTVQPNEKTYREKAARQLKLWPKLTVVPWPDA